MLRIPNYTSIVYISFFVNYLNLIRMEPEILDGDFKAGTNQKDIDIISFDKFIILCLLSFGLYSLRWMYKLWSFFKEKDKLDIFPIPRTIFSVIFLHSLFDRIQEYAKSNNYPKSYSSTLLFMSFVAINFTSWLPDPFSFLSLFSFIPLIPAFKAYNYSIKNSVDYRAVEKKELSTGQIVIIVLGILMWILFFVGIFMPVEEF